MKKPSSLMKTLQEYSEVSTVHGISYVFSRSLPQVDRLLWTILTVTRYTQQSIEIGNAVNAVNEGLLYIRSKARNWGQRVLLDFLHYKYF